MAIPIRVFISYSWDSPAHRQHVLQLAQRLRREGVDAWLDWFTPWPNGGWLRWMNEEIEQAKFVLVVCTSKYTECFAGKSPAGTGRGASREGCIIDQNIYDQGGRNDKFIPITFSDIPDAHVPQPLRNFPRFRADEEEDYIKLYRLIIGKTVPKPETVGDIRTLPETAGDIPLPYSVISEPLPVPEKTYYHRANGDTPRWYRRRSLQIFMLFLLLCTVSAILWPFIRSSPSPVVSVRITSPLSSTEVVCEVTDNGWSFNVQGTSAGVIEKDWDLLLLVDAPRPGYSRVVQCGKNGVNHISAETGNWSATAQVGNSQYKPGEGQTIDLHIIALPKEEFSMIKNKAEKEGGIAGYSLPKLPSGPSDHAINVRPRIDDHPIPNRTQPP